MCLFLWPLEYLIKKPPVHTKPATMSLIKVKPCNALLRILMVYIGICVKSVLRYKFVILDIYHPDTPYLCEQGSDDPWIFFEALRGPRKNNGLGKTAVHGQHRR
jgi:hypothetical protein